MAATEKIRMSNQKKYQVKLTKQGDPSKFWNTVEPLNDKGYPFISKHEDGQEFLYYIYKGLMGMAKPEEWRELRTITNVQTEQVPGLPRLRVTFTFSGGATSTIVETFDSLAALLLGDAWKRKS